MKQAEKSFIAILCETMIAFVFSGCATEQPVSPLQSAAGEVILKEPENPERWVEYGRACLFSNNPYGAELAFKKAIQLNEKYIPAYKHLGLVLVTLQRQSEAEGIYKQVLKISDSDSELWTAYGYCLIDLGKDKQALEAFQQSITLNSDPVSVISARLGVSALLSRQGDETGAQREYEEAVRTNPEIVQMLNEQKAVELEEPIPKEVPEVTIPEAESALVPSAPVLSKVERVEGVELRLKFSQGDSTAYKVTTEAQRVIKGEGALSDDDKFKGGTTGNRVEFTFTQQIQSVDAQGNAVAKITIDKLKYSAKVKDNITADFDSSMEKDRNSPLYKLIGQSYTIEITPEGQVSKIIDINQAQAAVTGSSSASEAASMLLKPEAIKLRHTIPAMPVTGPASARSAETSKNQLRQGDSWSNVKPFTFGMMGSKSYERVYTLKEIEDVDNRRIASVEMNANPSAETAGEPNQGQAMGIFSKMFDNTEKYTGGLKLDLNAGKVKEYFEKLQSEWVAVDPAAEQKPDSEPAALRMTATHFYHIELVRAEHAEVRKID